MTRGLARDWGRHNIRVNSILPGWVMTKRQLELWVTPEGIAALEAGQVLPGRVMPPDLARMTLFLAADENLFLQELRYHDRDADEELGLIELTRKQMAHILRTLKPEQFQKAGVHSMKGLLTLEKVVQGAINHVQHHLPFIHEKRKALGLS